MERWPADSKISRDEVERAQRHLFLCVGPDCCDPADGERLWQELKRRAKSLPVLRSRAGCLRVCRGGPWLVVYPEGVWYGNMTSERLQRVLDEHVAQGRPIVEWIAARSCG